MSVPGPHEVQARFMFGILGYQTYNLYASDEWIGQVTVNAMDRSFGLTLHDDGADPYRLRELRSWTGWVTYLRTHLAPNL